MSSSDSKAVPTDDTDGNDDGCIGNRRVRTIILASVIFAFFVFGVAWLAYNEETARDAAELYNDAYDDCVDAVGEAACDAGSTSQTDNIESIANAWAFIIAGAVVSMIGCVSVVLLFFIPGCDDKLGRVAGLVLIVGGVVYMIGWIWLIAAARDGRDDDWDDYTDEQRELINSASAAKLGEALLAGGMTILLGVDALLQIFDNEAFRLASNLGIILVVAGMCSPSYYLLVCDEEEGTCVTPNGVEMIATGYLVLLCATATYIVLFLLTCCTCNLKDKRWVRVALAAALVIGGWMESMGYYAYSGGTYGATDYGADSDPAGKNAAYWIGYSILIAGMCIVWAVDIALDDVKN